MDDLDHRHLGVQLKLWHLQEDAPGMVFWHPRGTAIYRVLEDYVRRKMRRAGYAEVRTPQLLPQELWARSGHWDKFGEHMFRVGDGFRVDDGEAAMALKPMSCPCHVQIFNKGLRSWRELPIRYAEFGACHRNEPSGSLHGIMRTRAFEQDDAHVFCREQDVEGEVARFAILVSPITKLRWRRDRQCAPATTRRGTGRRPSSAMPRGNAASRLGSIPARARSMDRSWNSRCATVSADPGSAARCSSTACCRSGSMRPTSRRTVAAPRR
jgi:threonyl-tRNA synthetase